MASSFLRRMCGETRDAVSVTDRPNIVWKGTGHFGWLWPARKILRRLACLHRRLGKIGKDGGPGRQNTLLGQWLGAGARIGEDIGNILAPVADSHFAGNGLADGMIGRR